MNFAKSEADKYIFIGNLFTEWDESHKCEPSKLTDEEREKFGVFHFVSTPVPDFDRLTQSVRESDALLIDGEVVQQWEVYPLPDEMAAENVRQAVQSRVEALWRAADGYTSGYISGVAIGLLTMGVLQGKPKALAVQAWSGAVWDEYYRRKSAVDAYTEVDLDFSACGPMPCSVPELRAELGL